MGNFITASSANFYPGAESAYVTNSNANFPAANLLLYTRPYRPWKSSTSPAVYAGSTSDNTRTYGGVELGSAQSITAVIVDNINRTSVYIQYSSNGTSWTNFGSGNPLTVSVDPTSGKYKVIQTGSVSARYWRVIPNSDKVAGTDDSLVIGSFVVVSTYTTWNTNAGFPYSAIGVYPAIPNSDGVARGAFPVRVGNPYAEITLTSSMLPTSAEADLRELMTYGEHQPLLFYRNFSSTAEVYLCHVVGQLRYALAGPNHLTLSEILLRECC